MMQSLPARYLRDSFVANGAKNGALGPAGFGRRGVWVYFLALSLRSFFRLGLPRWRAKYLSFPDGAGRGGQGERGGFGR